MPLRLADFSPAHLGTLNRWAEGNDAQLNDHDKQLKQLHSMLEAVFQKNPSLIRPNK